MDDRITIYQGDCLEILKTLPDESVDAVVTDPPAGIGFMGKDWDKNRGGRKEWSQWLSDRLRECLRVAKPGAHALVWAFPRTSHWTACAIEDSGWIVEDRIAHIFGTGFPKHKYRLKPAVEDWWLTTKSGGEKWLGVDACRVTQEIRDAEMKCQVENVTRRGRWPTNIVLSHHPECKPNGTKKIKGNGTINWTERSCPGKHTYGDMSFRTPFQSYADVNGIETVQSFDCHPDCPVRLITEQGGESKSSQYEHKHGFSSDGSNEGWKRPAHKNYKPTVRGYSDSGAVSRFFPGFLYCPKANRLDRGEDNVHPTVKAEPLMRWLCKLVTPPGGTVLDPFAGSGSTGFAAEAEGFHSILIEQNPEYIEIIKCRMNQFQEQTPLFK